MGWGTLGVFGGLDCPYSVSLWSTVHACFLTSVLPLHFTFLYLTPETRARIFVPEKCCPISAPCPLLQLHPVLFQSILLPRVLVCYYQQSLIGSTSIWQSLFETDTLTFTFWTSPPTCIIFPALFVLSHLLFFRHVTKSASGTPVPSSQSIILLYQAFSSSLQHSVWL